MFTYLARRVALLALVPVIASYVAWFLGGGLATALDNNPRADGGKSVKDGVGVLDVIAAAPGRMAGRVEAVLGWLWAQPPVQAAVLVGLVGTVAVAVGRHRSRRDTPRVLMRLRPYRTDQASGEQLVAMYDAIGKALLERWWRRLARGQQAATLRVRYARDKRGVPEGRFFLLCPESRVRSVQSALLGAYPNLTFDSLGGPPAEEAVPVVLRLKKRTAFVNRLREVDPHDGKPIHPNQMDRLLSRMDNVAEGSWIDLPLTPPPQSFSHLARRAYRKRQHEIADARGEETASFAPTPLEQKELEGAVDIAHHQLFFADLRVVADTMHVAERVAAELKVEGAENGLVERGTYLRHGLLRLYARRVRRGDSQPIPGFNRSVFASSELAALFHMPSVNYTQVRVARHSVPRAPAPPEIYRPEHTRGILEDLAGPVALHPAMRSQNMAVVGTVKQGKTSLLVASIAEDLARRDACVILLDPKGDAASAAATIVPPKRGCVILDMANPIVGYNPLAAPAAPDVVADYVVEAMKNIFDEGDIRASSDRYLRNAIMAALASAEVDTQQTRAPTLEDAVKLLSPTDSGHRERERVSGLIRSNPRWVNIHQFFAEELEAQLRDAKAMTTAKLDAPANKAARFLNSPSMQAIFKNTHYAVDFTEIIRGRQVLIVKGALGSMGKENTAVLMQLLVGGLDAALARQQDELEARDRSAVCLKVDEAPLVLNRGFTSTMALKRSAGLEVLAAWQTDSMWEDADQRAQLDALFAHRCYFQTASAEDARHAGNLMMAEYSDQVSTEQHGGRLKHRLPPDVQLHLRPHHALCTWTTPDGRAQPFTATTRPLPDDGRWWDYHLARLAAKGAQRVTELVDPGDPTFPEIPAGATAPGPDRGDGVEPDDVREPADDPLIGTVTPPLPEPGCEASHGRALARNSAPAVREPDLEPEQGEPVAVSASAAADRPGEDESEPSGPTKVTYGWELPAADPADPADDPTPAAGASTNGNGASPDQPPAPAAHPNESRADAQSGKESNGGCGPPDLAATGMEPDTASPEEQTGSASSEAAGAGVGRGEKRAQPAGTPAADETPAEPEAPARPNRVRRVKIDDEETKDQIERAARPARQAARTTSPLRKLGSFDGDAPPSFAVFADLDECRRWTHVKTAAHVAIEKQKPMPERPSRERLQPLDMVALARIAEMRFMLADQIGDRFMPDKAKRSVQRQIKLWEDLGLIRRMQFWKKASGASRGPVALYVTDTCIEMLKAFPTRDGLLLAENFDSKGPAVEDDAAHFPRHDVRVAGWVSKFEMLAGRLASEIRGPRSAFLRPPRPRERKDQRPAIGPADLNCTGRGYEVLDLTDGYGKPAEIFNKIEPDAGVLITTRNGDNIRRIDVLVELDRTGEPIKNARKFARYDQLITGWAEAHPRYARFGEGPMAVFVCKDGNQAREFAKAADDIVTGARARTGVPRRDWEYPGRRRMFFVAEGDIHQGMLDSLRLENLPPALRNADKPKGRRSFNPEHVEFFSPSLFTRRNGS